MASPPVFSQFDDDLFALHFARKGLVFFLDNDGALRNAFDHAPVRPQDRAGADKVAPFRRAPRSSRYIRNPPQTMPVSLSSLMLEPLQRRPVGGVDLLLFLLDDDRHKGVAPARRVVPIDGRGLLFRLGRLGLAGAGAAGFGAWAAGGGAGLGASEQAASRNALVRSAPAYRRSRRLLDFFAAGAASGFFSTAAKVMAVQLILIAITRPSPPWRRSS